VEPWRALAALSLPVIAAAQNEGLVFERDGRVIRLCLRPEHRARDHEHEPCRCHRCSGIRDCGESFIAGWTHERDAEGYDVYRSEKMWCAWLPAICPRQIAAADAVRRAE